ncbi:hypothetical protein BDFB_013325 [Asbolus verrucosus]|uniref:Uncharacterized protein n=1 Tax=Asbolus verrucosus TaxID=1661398 RepID=A0A482VZV7_ASBVE|nr:hypothetical protein BDFB_013325 [Asbolus verrucosus]
MVYSTEQKAFMTESYFRNEYKINSVWSYSLQNCFNFRILSFIKTINYILFHWLML